MVGAGREEAKVPVCGHKHLLPVSFSRHDSRDIDGILAIGSVYSINQIQVNSERSEHTERSSVSTHCKEFEL